MIVPMATMIVFSDGAKITVIEDADKVKERLTVGKGGTGEAFTPFEGQGGRVVHIAADQVAYIEEISSTASG